MAINSVWKAALKALSYPDIDVKNNYKIERTVVNATHYPYLRMLYKAWDRKIFYKDHDIPVRVFQPDMERIDQPKNVIIFFHGGGWVTGNIDSYTRVCSSMAKLTNKTVISVDYQLAPEHPFPAGLEDCYAVAKEIYLNTDTLNINKDTITIMGDSAGGNLAAALSLMARDKGEFIVKHQILIYPATYNNHTNTSPFKSVMQNGTGYLLTAKRVCDYMDLYTSDISDRENPYFAPLLAEDFSNQPKTLIITAQYDLLRDEGEMYGKKLKRAGNDVRVFRIHDALHGFFSMPSYFPQVKCCYKLINRFLGEIV